MRLLKSLAKISAATATFTLAMIAGQQNPGFSQSMPVCPATGTLTQVQLGTNYSSGCKGTPEVYGLVFFEMGLCQGNPMSSGTFDPSLCTASYNSTGGDYHDIAGSSVQLGAGNGGVRPPNGSYDVAYVIISNVFTLKGNYATTANNFYSNGTNYSDSATNVSTGATSLAQEFTDSLTSFGGATCVTKGSESMPNGNLEAYVTDGTLAVATGCTGVSRIVGTLTLNTPIEITEATTGLQVNFSVEDNGMTVIPDSQAGVNQGNPFALSSGPFSASFVILE